MAVINKVLDLGCGDWQFSQFVNWKDKEYIGIDCVDSVIANNNKQFANEKIKFKKMDFFNSL